jgi:hypothetical protein
MDYILIIIFQVLGVMYRAGKQVGELKKKYPQADRKHVTDLYFKEDWNVLAMSVVVLLTDLAVHYVVSMLGINWTQKFELLGVNLTWGAVYLLFSAGIAIVLGYKGQDLIYKWLGTAADRLDKEVSQKIQ